MKALVLDTSLQGFKAALLDEGSCVWQVEKNQPKETVISLGKTIEGGLRDQRLGMSDMDALVVSHGPGSFTGIKIGLSWAYGVKAAFPELKLYEYSTLELALSEISESYLGAELLWKSTSKDGYLISKTQKGIHSRAIVHRKGDTPEYLATHCGGEVFYVDESWTLMREGLDAAGKAVRPVTLKEIWKQAFIGLGRKYRELNEVSMLTPMYLRKSTAEEKLDEKNT